MLKIEIDGKSVEVDDGSTIMDAANSIGTHIPHFCYHKKLSIAANCRMCLVQVEKFNKPLPACATPVADGMKIYTRSKAAEEAQKSVMEFLLINHPLDCPICDQGGECDLQDIAVAYGASSLAVWLIGPIVKAAGFATLLWVMAVTSFITLIIVSQLPHTPIPADAKQ